MESREKLYFYEILFEYNSEHSSRRANEMSSTVENMIKEK